MVLVLYGISHKTAPVALRSNFVFSTDEIEEFLPELCSLPGVSEGLLLSTCNRTEIYAVCDGLSVEDDLKGLLNRFKGIKSDQAGCQFYFYSGLEVARHLFRVSAGLESQMVGENQIKNQIKEAYKIACRIKTNGTVLNKLFHKAFRVAKVARSETTLSEGAVSLSSAAVELASEVYQSLEDKNALLIGAGETGELVATHLMRRGVSTLKIINRTKCRPEKLSCASYTHSVDYSDLVDEFFKNDLVVSATSSPDYVVTAEMLKKVVKQSDKKVVVIDLAVPRDIDPAVAGLDGVTLFNIDDLKGIINKNLGGRMDQIPKVEKIVEKYVTLFGSSL